MTAFTTTPKSNLVDYAAWIASMGKSRQTALRWRKRYPVLKTRNIAGRLYITRDAIAEFEGMAERGELAKKPTGAVAESIEKSLARKTAQ